MSFYDKIFFLGPAAGILGQKYGLRAVTVLGGIIGSLSAIIPYFQMNITSITVLWGLFFGELQNLPLSLTSFSDVANRLTASFST